MDMAAYSSTSMSLHNNDDEDDSGLPLPSRFAVCEEKKLAAVPSEGGWDLGGFYSPPRTPPGGVGVRFPVPTAGSRPVRVCVVPGATQRYWKSGRCHMRVRGVRLAACALCFFPFFRDKQPVQRVRARWVQIAPVRLIIFCRTWMGRFGVGWNGGCLESFSSWRLFSYCCSPCSAPSRASATRTRRRSSSARREHHA